MRLIDADHLNARARSKYGSCLDAMLFQQFVSEEPTVDAVPVRCGECKLHGSCTFEETFITAGLDESHRYCGAGERKDGEK